jgi:hypothetical protein
VAVLESIEGFSMTKAEIIFPHCDARILHAPGECEYCDDSGLQPAREAWGIAFTGHPEEGKVPCPGETARGSENLNAWSGNRAKPTLESVAAHLTDTADIDAAVQLVQLMQQLSEEMYAAGWLIDWEYIVWDDVNDKPRASRRIDEKSRDRLVELSRQAGGWVYMPDDYRIIDPQFIRMGDWLKRVEAR